MVLEATGSALPPTVVKNIGDKLYEKRKAAALEIEQLVKTLRQQGRGDRVMELIDALIQYALSSQSNARKGGLLGLAATAVGLAAAPAAPPVPGVLPKIVPPILNSFTDQDSRVRYYAAEALYNVAKSLRGSFMEVFTDCFEALFKICSDPDPSVQSAATFLDRLIKDIVAESHTFDLAGFLPLLQEYLTLPDPYKRQFLLSWLGLLDSLPEVSLVPHLPCLLPGLLGLLSDTNPEIRQGATKLLQEFLLEVHTSPSAEVDLPALAEILASQLLPHSAAAAAQAAGAGGALPPADVAVQLTALRWLHELIELGGEALAPQYASMLRAVLPCLADDSSDICQARVGGALDAARQVNESLLQRCSGAGREGQEHGEGGPSPAPFVTHTPSLLQAVRARLEGEQEVAKLEALRWVHALMGGASRQVLMDDESLLGALCEALSSPSDRVVLEALGVMASIAEDPTHFLPVVRRLLGCFRGASGAKLLQRRGALIVQLMCKRLGGQQVYRAVAGLVDEVWEVDFVFAAAMVQAFNLILLTSPELGDMRQLISHAASDAEGARLFTDLFTSWSCSCGAALALCLLGQVHNLACELVAVLGREPLCCSVEVLVQVSQLVQLLEAPSLAGLRLQILQPATHPALLRSLYGLLMLLPQSGDAFRTLHTRLQCAPALALLLGSSQQEQQQQQRNQRIAADKGRRQAGTADGSIVDEAELLRLFVRRQEQLHSSSNSS
ncbi:hypothetical protein N2152v2_001830 [Parachlorella kessleri]